MIRYFIRRSATIVLAASVLFLILAGRQSTLGAGDQEYCAVMAWNKLQMYERGSNGKLRQRSFAPEKEEWSEWEDLTGGGISSSPSALMTNGGTRLAVFFRGFDGRLYHIFRDEDSDWSGVIRLGSREMQSAPNAVIVGNVLTVFARGTDGKLMKIYYDGKQASWTDWSDVD